MNIFVVVSTVTTLWLDIPTRRIITVDIISKMHFNRGLLFLQFLSITTNLVVAHQHLGTKKYFEREIDAPNFDFKQDTSEDECIQFCISTPNCTSYTWQRSTLGNCFLKNVTSPATRPQSGHWAGVIVDESEIKNKPLWGLAYQPYQSSQSCDRSEADVNNELAQLAATVETIRLFGFDCENNVVMVVNMSRNHGLKVIIGLWLNGFENQYEGEKSKFENFLKKGLNMEHVIAINVGTLTLYNSIRIMTESELIEKIVDIRNLTRFYGYKDVPISTVDVFAKYSPHLMQHVDIVLPSLEVFELGSSVDVAVHLIKNQWQNIKSQADQLNKRVIVADSGWPSGGNGSMANIDNHRLFHKMLKCTARKEGMRVVHFEAFDGVWKTYLDTDDVEKHMGLGTVDRAFKSDMYEDFMC